MSQRRGGKTGTVAALLTAVLAATCAGCLDMPLAPPGDYSTEAPRVLDGPYLDGAGMAAGQPIATEAPSAPEPEMTAPPVLRTRLNRPATIALRRNDGGGVKRVDRNAGFSATPSTGIGFLTPGRRETLTLVVADRDGPTLSLRAPSQPETTEPVRIAFVSEPRPEMARLLESGDVDALVVLHPGAEGEASPERARENGRALLAALGSVAWRAPLHFAPGAGAGLPRDLFPNANRERWVRRVGNIALYGVNIEALSNPKTRDAERQRLIEQLRQQPPHTRYRIAVLSRALYDGELEPDVIAGLGDELEAAGVDLAVSAGRPGYCRTYSLTGGRGGRTRYIALGAGMAAMPRTPHRLDFVAAGDAESPALGVLSYTATYMDGAARPYGRVEWTAYRSQGAVMDELRYAMEADSDAVYEKRGLMEEAYLVQRVREELERVTRQAARAVADPARPVRLPVAVENPATRPLSVRLTWNGVDEASYPGRGWTVKPESVEVPVAPGRGAVAWFEISPGPGREPVSLAAVAGEAGTARERLILTARRAAMAHFTNDRIDIDGRLRDREGAWDNFPNEALQLVSPGIERPTRARVAADAKGLLVAFQCILTGNPRNMPLWALDREKDYNSDRVLLDEGVEVWVDPANRGRDWYRFAINMASVRRADSSRGRVIPASDWEGHVMRDAGAKPPRYWVEMRIPWAAVGVERAPEPGEEWAINLVRRDTETIRESIQQAINRTRQDEGSRHATAGRTAPPEPVRTEWASTEGVPTRSGLYGAVRFAGAKPSVKPEPAVEDPTPTQLGDPSRFMNW